MPYPNATLTVAVVTVPSLTTCANVPVDLYASSRSPASLLIGHTTANTQLTPNSDIPYFNDAFPLPTGPSTIRVAHIINSSGQLETRIFVVCFDSRRVAIYDPVARDVEAWVTTGRGPQAIAFDVIAPSQADAGHAYAYVGHFTDSYIGVIELDRRRGRSYGTIVLSLGLLFLRGRQSDSIDSHGWIARTAHCCELSTNGHPSPPPIFSAKWCFVARLSGYGFRKRG